MFPEEVEEALKTHAAVRDVLVVGVPDDRFVEAICAVVELNGGTRPEPAELIAHVKERLASFKAPRHVLIVDSVGRAPNGKADYPRAPRGRRRRDRPVNDLWRCRVQVDRVDEREAVALAGEAHLATRRAGATEGDVLQLPVGVSDRARLIEAPHGPPLPGHDERRRRR